MSPVTSLLFCGTGGQGVLTAAEVCGWAALRAGFHVKKSEVHGMAQRGGSVESHLRFGEEVFSPLIPDGGADFLIPFHAEEENRLAHFLKPGGQNLIASLADASKLEDRKFVNTYLLGVLSARMELAREHWVEALKIVYRGRRIEENIRYFELGAGKK